MRHNGRSSVWLAALAACACLAAGTMPAMAGGGDKHDIEVGAYAGYGYPDSYGDLNPDSDFLWGVRGAWFITPRWSFEGSWQTLGTSADPGGVDATLNALRGNVLYNFRPGKKFRWFLTAGLGRESTTVDDLGFDRTDWGYNVGGGGRWYFGRKRTFGVRADARWVTIKVGGSVDSTQSNYEGTGGLLWSFGGGTPPDSDGDGVPDKKDACPGTPKGAHIDAKGCPKDSDGDGVPDGIDKCADTPRGWAVDATGCPKDSDGDGVADALDKCPGTPKDVKVDTSGCPSEDEDGDGVWDGQDRCPHTPKGAKVDMVGCPTDADGDGVWDGLDQCPDTPKGTPVDETGCPK
jgi:hypothetical protein